ncbi:AMP-binding protein [Streptomyces sp. BE147]|uniref:AMP-binding protein n=1 Tax=unclassified Streptomyces TaxID=2593676 RepID=UPI002E78959C|nr:AMP-binding protein [Streptomyces sp. BE147]MEE1736887.1 AMP-binding protein [Streptomyces sp. BE147]
MNAPLPTPQDPLHSAPGYARLILTALRRRPDHLAFRWSDNGRERSLTYRATADMIERTATALARLRPAPGSAVALLTGPRPEAFVVMAAACLAGIRFAALHPLGNSENDAYVLRDSGAGLLIVDEDRFADRAAEARAMTEVVSLSALSDLAGRTPPAAADPLAEACYLFYTGGTTGEPKGVVLGDRSLTANAWACTTWAWPERTTFLITTPMSHAAGLLVAPGLLRGATFVIHPGFDPGRVIDAIEEGGVNTTFLVPTMLYTLLDHPRTTGADLSGLRWILYGAAPIDRARLVQARDRFGPILSQHYGQAEAPNALTVLDPGEHLSDDPAVLTSCGRPMPGNEIVLIDPAGHPVATGEPGELCVRGPLVMDGYWNKPDQTRAALQDGWLHTGDIARADSTGLLTIVDRIKDTIITGGFNVYPREVEDALTGHPAVAHCAVYGEPDPQWGEAVVAAVVLRSGFHATPTELAAHVRDVKGAVWAPKRVRLCAELPQTALGKIDRKALRGSS